MHSLRNDQSSCNRALVGRCAVSVLLSGALLMISGVSTTRVGAQGQAAPEKFRRVANPARFITHASPTSQEDLTSNTALTTLNWHHLAAVFDGSEKRLYIDGVLDKWFPSTFAPGTGGGRLTIGAAPDATQFFNGLIDEVRVTADAVYTGSSFNHLALRKLTGVPGTRGLWRFDRQNAKDCADINNGTLVGGATFSTSVP